MASGAEGSEDCCRRTLAPELQMYIIPLQQSSPNSAPLTTLRPERTAQPPGGRGAARPPTNRGELPPE